MLDDLNEKNLVNLKSGTSENVRNVRNDGMLNVPFGSEIYETRTIEYLDEDNNRSRLIFVDEQRKKIHVFNRKDVEGVVRILNQKADSQGTLYTLEINKNFIECVMNRASNGYFWTERNTLAAYDNFKKKFKVDIPISVFKGMLIHYFSNEYKQLLEGSKILHSVRGDGRAPRKTSIVKYDYIRKNDGLYARLFFIKDGQIIPFFGASIKDVAAVISSERIQDKKQYGTAYTIEVPENVTAITIQPRQNGRLWPQCDFLTAYNDFKKDVGVEFSFETFKKFLLDNYKTSYERIENTESQIRNFAKGREVEFVEIETTKRSYREPHSDIKIVAPDGREWLISYKATSGTEIDGICRIVDRGHRDEPKRRIEICQLVVTKGVIVTQQHYPKGTDYPSWYFLNGYVHERGTTICFQNQNGVQEKRKEDSEPEVQVSSNNGAQEVLSQKDALAALKKIFG